MSFRHLLTCLFMALSLNVARVHAQEAAHNSSELKFVEQEPTFQTKNSTENRFWTPEIRTEYSHRRLDSSQWDLEMFEVTLQIRKQITWPTEPALSFIFSSVPKYQKYLGDHTAT